MKRLNLITRYLTSAAILVVVFLPPPAEAQTVGVSAGISVDPEQFVAGGHFETGPLVERLHFRPSVDFGFGDDVTRIGLNFEFIYKLPIRNTGAWTLYAGGGPAMNIYATDDDSDGEPGINALFGAEAETGLFFEAKFGMIDSPTARFLVGWNFR